jgi:hypothetical protein
MRPAAKANVQLTTPLLIALVTLKGYDESTHHGKKLYIKDLSEYLVVLQQNGIDINRIAISGLPGNYWSDDVARFVGEGIVIGDIKHKSPLEITDECKDGCLVAIYDRVKNNAELKPLIEQASRILKLNLELPAIP